MVIFSEVLVPASPAGDLLIENSMFKQCLQVNKTHRLFNSVLNAMSSAKGVDAGDGVRHAQTRRS